MTANQEFVQQHKDALKIRRETAASKGQSSLENKIALSKTTKRKTVPKKSKNKRPKDSKPGYEDSVENEDGSSTSDYKLDDEKYRAALHYADELRERGYPSYDEYSKKQTDSQTGPSKTKMLKLENGGHRVISEASPIQEKSKGKGMEYIADTIPWRYRQDPCPGKYLIVPAS